MRARRDLISDWERGHSRSWVYAGVGKGADMAAWRQSASAELAAAMKTGYTQALLDLVKAFDHVPHDVLFREAVKLGYPLWILRLALATYKLQRVIRVGNVVSRVVVATKGMTAGSGSSTTEMLLVMFSIVISAITAHPCVSPFLFVDDLAIETYGSPAFIRKHYTLNIHL